MYKQNTVEFGDKRKEFCLEKDWWQVVCQLDFGREGPLAAKGLSSGENSR